MNREATTEETRNLYLAGGEAGFERLPHPRATLADLSKPLITRYRHRRERASNFALDITDEELLRNRGCLVGVNGDLRPTQAGVLLFCEEPQRFLPQSEMTVVRFKGNDVVEYLMRKGRLTNTAYQEMANVGRTTAKRELQELLSKRIIKAQGSGRGFHYILHPKWSP
jgi:predicted HTH transcriptional regulator